MTVQMVLLNRAAAVVASDSARVVGGWDGERVLTGAQKLFDLGAGHRVVVSISGLTHFMGVPYEVHLARWRESLTGPLASPAAYLADLRAWLMGQAATWPQVEVDVLSRALGRFFTHVARRIDDEVAAAGLVDAPWDDLDVQAAVTMVVTEELEHLAGLPAYSVLRADGSTGPVDADGHDVLGFVEAHRSLVASMLRDAFDGTPRTVLADVLLREKAPALLLTRIGMALSPGCVCVTGYGDGQVWPSAAAMELATTVAGRLLWRGLGAVDVDAERGAALWTFGQDDAIRAFLRGASPLDPGPTVRTKPWAETLADAEAAGDDVPLDELSGQPASVASMLDGIAVLLRHDLARAGEAFLVVALLDALRLDRPAPCVAGPLTTATISPVDGIVWNRPPGAPARTGW